MTSRTWMSRYCSPELLFENYSQKLYDDISSPCLVGRGGNRHQIVQQEAYRLHVKITDADADRWEVPADVVSMPTDDAFVAAVDYTTSINPDPHTRTMIRP